MRHQLDGTSWVNREVHAQICGGRRGKFPPPTRHCQDARRRGSHEHMSFTFLGYGFRGRRVRTRSGRITTGFVPAISKDAMNKISSEVRSWRLHTRTGLSESDLARRINPIV